MNFAIAVKAFIVKNNELLLLQRGLDRPHKPGQWDIPGGRLEPNEDFFAGLRREAEEESGLAINIVAPIEVHHFTRDDGQRIAMLICLCAPADPAAEVKLSHEHQAFRWHPLSDRAGLPEWVQPVLDAYNKAGLGSANAN